MSMATNGVFNGLYVCACRIFKFITEALEAGGRVMVHCDQVSGKGGSRGGGATGPCPPPQDGQTVM